jgi:tetratricopeptide (TPR) repeat protein
MVRVTRPAVACALALLAAACAGGRRAAAPPPHVRDAAILRSEARARGADAEPLYQLALLHDGSGAPDSALAALRVALRRDPEHMPSLALFAHLMHQTGRSAEGLRFFARLPAERLPAAVRRQVAVLRADVGDAAGGRLLAGEVSGAVAEYAVARAWLQAGDLDGGVRLLKRLADLHPEFAPAQVHLALVLQDVLFESTGTTLAGLHLDDLAGPPWEALAGGPPASEDAAPPEPAAPR